MTISEWKWKFWNFSEFSPGLDRQGRVEPAKDKVSGEGAFFRLDAYGHIRIIIIRVHIITRNSRHLNHEHYPLDLKTLKVTLTNHKILKT